MGGAYFKVREIHIKFQNFNFLLFNNENETPQNKNKTKTKQKKKKKRKRKHQNINNSFIVWVFVKPYHMNSWILVLLLLQYGYCSYISNTLAH